MSPLSDPPLRRRQVALTHPNAPTVAGSNSIKCLPLTNTDVFTIEHSQM